mgnify:CR=1 FL=1
MKKLVLVAALFMFVCGGTFLAQAKAPVEQPSKTTTLSNDTVVTDTLQKARRPRHSKSGPITVSTLQQKAVSSLSILGNGFFN